MSFGMRVRSAVASLVGATFVVAVSLALGACGTSGGSASADPTVPTTATSIVATTSTSAPSTDSSIGEVQATTVPVESVSTPSGPPESDTVDTTPVTEPPTAGPDPLPAQFDLRSSFDLDGDGLADRITIRTMGAGSASATATLTTGGTHDIGILHPLQAGTSVAMSCEASSIVLRRWESTGGPASVQFLRLVPRNGSVVEEPFDFFMNVPFPASVVDSNCR